MDHVSSANTDAIICDSMACVSATLGCRGATVLNGIMPNSTASSWNSVASTANAAMAVNADTQFEALNVYDMAADPHELSHKDTTSFTMGKGVSVTLTVVWLPGPGVAATTAQGTPGMMMVSIRPSVTTATTSAEAASANSFSCGSARTRARLPSAARCAPGEEAGRACVRVCGGSCAEGAQGKASEQARRQRGKGQQAQESEHT
jgi:hypothetical protein